MPITTSAKKALKRSEKNRATNSEVKLSMIAAIRNVKRAIVAGESGIEDKIKVACSKIDKAVRKNILHRNSGARKKASLCKMSKAA